MKKILFITIAILTLVGCEPHVKVDAPGLREAVENRKIKQIHEPEIQARALVIGKKLTLKTDSLIKAYYTNLDSIDCNSIATINTSKISEGTKISILCDLKDGDEMEKQLFDALQYNFENNIEYSITVQKVKDNYYMIEPIKNNNELKGAISVIIPKKLIVLSLSDDTWKYKYEKRDKK